LMNIEADILLTVHRVPPSFRSMVLTLLITYSKGAPFYNAIAIVTRIICAEDALW
jgi:hypothetical protein